MHSAPECSEEVRRVRADQRDLAGAASPRRSPPGLRRGPPGRRPARGGGARPTTLRSRTPGGGAADDREVRCGMGLRGEQERSVRHGAGGDEDERVSGHLLQRAAIRDGAGHAERDGPDHPDVRASGEAAVVTGAVGRRGAAGVAASRSLRARGPTGAAPRRACASSQRGRDVADLSRRAGALPASRPRRGSRPGRARSSRRSRGRRACSRGPGRCPLAASPTGPPRSAASTAVSARLTALVISHGAGRGRSGLGADRQHRAVRGPR